MQLTASANLSSARRANSGPRNRQDPPEVEADVRGHFQFTLEKPGAYVITGSARDYRRQNFDSHDGFFSSIVLTPAEPAANITFRMERDAAITGLVLDEAGEPVQNAQVIAETPGQLEDRPTRGRGGRGGGGFEGRPVGFGQTDDRGRYELSGLAPGSYRVRVTAQPWYAQGNRFNRTTSGPSPDPSLDLVYPVVWYPGVEDDASAEFIQLTGGEDRQADFHLTPIPAVHLVVPRPEAPVSAAGAVARLLRPAFLVRVSPAGGNVNQNVTVRNDATEFSGISPGLYELHTTGTDGRPDPEAKQIRILPGASGVVDLSTATVLTKVVLKVEGVENGETIQFTFVDAVTGRTVSPDGGFGGRRRDKDAERAIYLAPGKWEVNVPAYSTTYLEGLQATGADVTGATVNIGSQPATLTLAMGTGRAEISGIAALAGKPDEGAMVLLVPAGLGEPGNVTEVQRDQTNTDGSFNLLGVVPGKYILLAIDHGWDVKWRDLPTLATYLTRGMPVEVKPNDKVMLNVAVSPR